MEFGNDDFNRGIWTRVKLEACGADDYWHRMEGNFMSQDSGEVHGYVENFFREAPDRLGVVDTYVLTLEQINWDCVDVTGSSWVYVNRFETEVSDYAGYLHWVGLG
jgi:hypothetical protein